MEKKVIDYSRSEFFSKILKTFGGLFFFLAIPKKIFVKTTDRLNPVEFKEHPSSVKRSK